MRKKINKDGKNGLNFSPKQLSVFSGASDTILLSKGSSLEESGRRGEIFSFGSTKREEKRVKGSLKREMAPFLDPGRACMTKRRL